MILRMKQRKLAGFMYTNYASASANKCLCILTRGFAYTSRSFLNMNTEVFDDAKLCLSKDHETKDDRVNRLSVMSCSGVTAQVQVYTRV